MTFAAGPGTSEYDRARFLGCATAPRVIAIENVWLERAARQVLWVYPMPADGFEKIDNSAGYYVSRQPVRPEAPKRVRSALAGLIDCDVELRIVPDLWPLRDLVVQSTLDFSNIHMRNALPRR